MPSSIPDARTLLDAAIKYLEDELLPELTGYHRFKTRVTANVMITIRRELELGARHQARERGRLEQLLGHEGDVAQLSLELSERLRSRTIDLKAPAVWTHIRASLAEALEINNPKWLVL